MMPASAAFTLVRSAQVGLHAVAARRRWCRAASDDQRPRGATCSPRGTPAPHPHQWQGRRRVAAAAGHDSRGEHDEAEQLDDGLPQGGSAAAVDSEEPAAAQPEARSKPREPTLPKQRGRPRSQLMHREMQMREYLLSQLGLQPDEFRPPPASWRKAVRSMALDTLKGKVVDFVTKLGLSATQLLVRRAPHVLAMVSTPPRRGCCNTTLSPPFAPSVTRTQPVVVIDFWGSTQ